MKKLTKKQQIRLSIGAGIAAVAIIGIAAFAASRPRDKAADKEADYEVVTVETAAPLIFKGSVKAEKTQDFYYDQSLGKITAISVADGQTVNPESVLLTYENATVQEQADEQNQSLARANLSLQNAQQSYDNAVAKQNELTNQYNDAANKANAQEGSTMEGQAKKSELTATAEGLKQSLDAQKDMVLQARQALESANLELSSTNDAIEKIKSKVSSNVTAGMDGIAYINEKGKSDPSTAVVTVVSPGTVIEASVSEYDYQRVQAEQKVTIKPTNGDPQIEGTITQVDKLPTAAPVASATGQSSSDSANYRFVVKPASDLQYGYTVQITLPLTELRIPAKSLVKEDEAQFVFIYKEGKAHKQPVKVTEKNGLFIVTEGLQEKDKIISDPDDKLKDGQEVAVN